MRQRPADLVEPFLNERNPFIAQLRHVVPDLHVVAHHVHPAVERQQLATARTFPPEHIRAIERRATRVLVDRHRVAFDPGVK